MKIKFGLLKERRPANIRNNNRRKRTENTFIVLLTAP